MAASELSRKRRDRTTERATKRKGAQALGSLILVGTLLALSLVVAKLADGHGAPRLAFLTVAMAGAGLVLVMVTAALRQPMRLDWRTLEYAVVSGFLAALPNALGFVAVRHVGAGFVSLGFAFPILFTWLMAVALRMERPRAMRLIGVLLGLAGGLVLAAARAGSGDGAGGWVALVLAMPVVIAVGNVYRTLRWPEGASPVFLAALMMLGAALVLLPLALALEPGQVRDLIGSAATVRLLLVEIGVFSVLYIFYFLLQKIAGPVYLSQIGTVAALVGTSIGVLALGEAPPPRLAWAGVLVASGTFLFHRGAPATGAASMPAAPRRTPDRPPAAGDRNAA